MDLAVRGVLISATMLLAGCQYGGVGMPGSPAWHATAKLEDQVRYFQTRCAAYGFKIGTPAMAQCIQTEAGNSRVAASNRMAIASAAMAASAPKHTTCNRFGNTVNCTTF